MTEKDSKLGIKLVVGVFNELWVVMGKEGDANKGTNGYSLSRLGPVANQAPVGWVIDRLASGSASRSGGTGQERCTTGSSEPRLDCGSAHRRSGPTQLCKLKSNSLLQAVVSASPTTQERVGKRPM